MKTKAENDILFRGINFIFFHCENTDDKIILTMTLTKLLANKKNPIGWDDSINEAIKYIEKYAKTNKVFLSKLISKDLDMLMRGRVNKMFDYISPSSKNGKKKKKYADYLVDLLTKH